MKNLGDVSLAYIPQDAYYKDQSHLTRMNVLTNYDHPFVTFDNDLLSEHISHHWMDKLSKCRFMISLNNRAEETICAEPKEVIIIEGILIF